MHEADLHEENCFGTLTYDREHLPRYGSLQRRDFQKFMKRVRRSVEPKKVRFFHAGEYGDRNGRPHYHFLLFGHAFSDRVAIRDGAIPLYRSESLEALWPAGVSSVGELCFESAAYVARYVMKKVDQVGRKKKYNVDSETGEMVEIQPEYATMSRGGPGRGLGFGWFEKYGDEVQRHDSIVVDGKEVGVPRYYDNLLAARDEVSAAEVKAWRLHAFLSSRQDVSGRERRARDAIARSRLALRERSL